jgi:hypothetical protein
MMPRFAVALLIANAAIAQVTTSQYDNSRTGATLHETALTPASVNSSRFGKLFTLAVDGDIYAQPLYLPKVEVPGKGVHNVVYVATEHDSVYAFDADGKPSEPLWQVNFLNEKAGVTTVPTRDVQCPFIRPEIGITPTPVIDRESGTLYVLARTKETEGRFAAARYVHRLHALAITTGVEKFGGPVEIKAPGFGGLRELPRAGLLLTHDQVYLTWASSCDASSYHGWIMAYDAKTLAQNAVLNTSPDTNEAGIWLSDAAPAADAEGRIFVPTGNGGFDNSRNWGDTLLKLNSELKILDYFTPSNQQALNREDADLGSGGPVLLPDQPGSHPHLLLAGGKEGVLYLLDRDNLGKHRPDNQQDSLGRARLGKGIYGAPAYWFGHIYVQARNDRLRDLSLESGQLLASKSSLQQFIPPATPVVSSNGSRDGIVWTIETKDWNASDRPAVLRAFDAADITHELFTSERNSARDRAGDCLRFTIPTVANGRVYVEAKRALEVYGLR